MTRAALIVLALVACAAAAEGQERTPGELYRTACGACHGADGTGQPRAVVGFATPLPDFTDCSFGTPEPDADWLAVTHDGGPARAFDRRMPAYRDVLSSEDIQRTVDYIRGFCRSEAWPRGELNLPRALVTEKAFPENEAVLTVVGNATEGGRLRHEFLYERRLGARSQFEVAVPWTVQQGGTTGWQRGLGDVAVAFKHALFHRWRRGTILSAAIEAILPTGKEAQGFGAGTTALEPFLAFGQILPFDGFVQLQAGVEMPFDGEDEAFWRAALGRSFVQGQFGRTWTPMIEALAARPLTGGATTQWDMVPQVQITLSKRQHIMMNAGVRVPVTSRSGRPTQVLAYFLWDWFDGGLREGWR